MSLISRGKENGPVISIGDNFKGHHGTRSTGQPLRHGVGYRKSPRLTRTAGALWGTEAALDAARNWVPGTGAAEPCRMMPLHAHPAVCGVASRLATLGERSRSPARWRSPEPLSGARGEAQGRHEQRRNAGMWGHPLRLAHPGDSSGFMELGGQHKGCSELHCPRLRGQEAAPGGAHMYGTEPKLSGCLEKRMPSGCLPPGSHRS